MSARAPRMQCSGRKCGSKITEPGRAARYAEERCTALCEADSELCKKCVGYERRYMDGINTTKKWHGTVDGPIPTYSHIVGSKWNIDTRAKENALSVKKETALAAAFEKAVKKTEKETERAEKAAAKAAAEAAKAAERLRKETERAEKASAAAAAAAEKAAIKAKRDGEKAAAAEALASEKAALEALRATKKAARNAEKEVTERLKAEKALAKEQKAAEKERATTKKLIKKSSSPRTSSNTRHRREVRAFKKALRGYVTAKGISNRPNLTRKGSRRRTSSAERSFDRKFNPFYGAGTASPVQPSFHRRRTSSQERMFNPFAPGAGAASRKIYIPATSSSSSSSSDILSKIMAAESRAGYSAAE